MAARRGLAIASALLALLAVAGCGLGPGGDLDPVTLTVTHEYGQEPVLEREVGEVTESDTVMRVLEGAAEIGTKEGGRFVKSIDGVESVERDGRYMDWLFYVNGVESNVGAAAFALRGGESIWWDYRDWTSALHVPAVVGSWPQPFTSGYEGSRHPVAVVCLGGGSTCAEVRERLAEAGVDVAAGSPPGAIRVLVGPWARVRRDPAAAQLEGGVGESGVFAEFGGPPPRPRLEGLDETGALARRFGPAAGLLAATRRYEAPPTWLVTGATPAGVREAASLLSTAKLRHHYAVAIEDGKETPLPVPGR
jgi:hypothetical protein